MGAPAPNTPAALSLRTAPTRRASLGAVFMQDRSQTWDARLERALRQRVRQPYQGPADRAAVAAILDPDGDLLLIRRSERAGDPWSGHLAFPGGRMQAEDGGPLQAAIRETWEEVGVDLREEGRLIGFLDELPAVRSGGVDRRLVVSPFVFACSRRPTLRPNHEVAGHYWWNIERLLAGEGRGEKEWNWQGQPIHLPAVRLEGAELWGMTLRMVDELLGSLREAEGSA